MHRKRIKKEAVRPKAAPLQNYNEEDDLFMGTGSVQRKTYTTATGYFKVKDHNPIYGR